MDTMGGMSHWCERSGKRAQLQSENIQANPGQSPMKGIELLYRGAPGQCQGKTSMQNRATNMHVFSYLSGYFA